MKPWVQTSAPHKPGIYGPGLVDQACDLHTEEVQEGRSVGAHPWHTEFEASWDTRKPVSKTKKDQKRRDITQAVQVF